VAPAVVVVQATWTLVTFAVAVPLPLVTAQVSAGLDGCVRTVTLYVPPLGIGVLNVKAVAAEATATLLLLLSCSTKPEPERPEIVPPIVYVVALQATWMFVTFALAVPLPLVTAQVSAGLEGCVRTVTLYVPPLGSVY